MNSSTNGTAYESMTVADLRELVSVIFKFFTSFFLKKKKKTASFTWRVGVGPKIAAD